MLCNISPWLVFYLIVCPLTLSNLNFPFILHSPHREPITCSHYVWVCFFFVRFISWLYFLDSPCKWYHTVFVLLWLLSLSIMPQVIFFMLLPMALFHPFFYGWAAYIYISHLLYPFICWWTLRLLPCLGYCIEINSSAMNIVMHAYFWTSIFICFGYMLIPCSEIAGSYDPSILLFWGTSILFSIMAAPIYNPTNNVLEFSFLHILINICY